MRIVDEQRANEIVEPSPAGRPVTARRLVKLLVLADVVVLILAAALWLALRDSDERENAVNDGLRGSLPPQGQMWPDLSEAEGIKPPFPTQDQVQGRSTVLVATCVECQSADIIGGFLSRLRAGDLPDDSRVVVMGWGGDVSAWATRWQLDTTRLQIHAAQSAAATSAVRRTIGIAPVDGGQESGAAFVYDARGRWRSTYFIGQLHREDIAHDLAALRDD